MTDNGSVFNEFKLSVPAKQWRGQIKPVHDSFVKRGTMGVCGIESSFKRELVLGVGPFQTLVDENDI
jgi:hypothetical protein